MLAPGTRLGPYEIVSAIGAGGMGEVYRARDVRLERPVAVKVVAATAWTEPSARDRFVREARTISSLEHPNICPIFDVGDSDGMPYLVMQYLEGETLAERLRTGGLPLEDALSIANDIAGALSCAHRSGVVHRDIKPGNVMLTRDGAKLLDFGLAKSASAVAEAAASSTPTREALTAHGTIVGTLHYMSPEQLEGRETDARADIWALGCVIYEMVAGRKAFDGTSQAGVISAIMAASPKPLQDTSEIAPPLLDRIVRGCFARNPDDRLQSARDIQMALSWIRDGLGGAASLERPPRSRRWPIALAAAAALAGAGFGASAVWRGTSGEAQTLRFEVAAPESFEFLDTPALSPDGRQVAAVVGRSDGLFQLWLRAFDNAAGTLLANTEGASLPFWSPDGASIAFFAGGFLRRVDVRSGSAITICPASAGRGGVWDADGTILFAPSNNGPLMRVSANGGAPLPFTAVAADRGELSHRFPFLLQDGYFGYYVLNKDAAESGVWVAAKTVPGSARRTFASEVTASFARDSLFFVNDATLLAQRFDAASGRLAGDPAPMAASVAPGQLLAARGFSVVDGAIATRLQQTPSTELIWYTREGRELESIAPAAPAYAFAGPSISPDGKQVAFVKDWDIWVHDLARRTTTRIAESIPGLGYPLWSRDGSHIVFGAGLGPGGNQNLYRMPAAGGVREAIAEGAALMEPVGWSRDGSQFIWIQVDQAPASTLKTMGSDGQPAVAFSSSSIITTSRVSPDGRALAFTSSQSGQPNVYLIEWPSAGPLRQVSVRGGSQPRWGKEGRELFYIAADHKLMRVPVQRVGQAIELGTPAPLFDLGDKALSRLSPYTYDVVPDGSRFLVNVKRQGTVPPLAIVKNWASR